MVNTAKDIIANLHTKRDETLSQIVSSVEEYRKYLDYSSRMFKYPFKDVLLMYSQSPDATAIAGVHNWSKVGRRVKTGANVIRIPSHVNPRLYERYYDIADTFGKDFTGLARYDVPQDAKPAIMAYFGAGTAQSEPGRAEPLETTSPHDGNIQNFDANFARIIEQRTKILCKPVALSAMARYGSGQSQGQGQRQNQGRSQGKSMNTGQSQGESMNMGQSQATDEVLSKAVNSNDFWRLVIEGATYAACQKFGVKGGEADFKALEQFKGKTTASLLGMTTHRVAADVIAEVAKDIEAVKKGLERPQQPHQSQQLHESPQQQHQQPQQPPKEGNHEQTSGHTGIWDRDASFVPDSRLGAKPTRKATQLVLNTVPDLPPEILHNPDIGRRDAARPDGTTTTVGPVGLSGQQETDNNPARDTGPGDAGSAHDTGLRGQRLLAHDHNAADDRRKAGGQGHSGRGMGDAFDSPHEKGLGEQSRPGQRDEGLSLRRVSGAAGAGEAGAGPYEIRNDVDGLYGADPSRQMPGSGQPVVGGHPQKVLGSGGRGQADDRGAGEPVRGEKPGPGQFELHRAGPAQERGEGIRPGDSFAGGGVQEQIRAERAEKAERAERAGSSEDDTSGAITAESDDWDAFVLKIAEGAADYKGPFVVIGFSEHPGLNGYNNRLDGAVGGGGVKDAAGGSVGKDGAVGGSASGRAIYASAASQASFEDADSAIRQIESDIWQRRGSGDKSAEGYFKTYGMIFYKNNPADTQLSTYDFQYDIGDYRGSQSGLYNHINNFWNSVEKGLQGIGPGAASAKQLYSRADVNNVRHMLNVLRGSGFGQEGSNSGKSGQTDLNIGSYGQADGAARENITPDAQPDFEGDEDEAGQAGGHGGGESGSHTDHGDVDNSSHTNHKAAPAFTIKSAKDIGMDIGGTTKAKFMQNLEAIAALKFIESQGRTATPEEQSVLAKYSGFGGIPQVFDETIAAWTSERMALKKIATNEEYKSLSASALNAHYTQPEIIKAMYKGLATMGFKGGSILEPSMGCGHFFGAMPEEMANSENTRLYGVELDELTGRIAKQLYPHANIEITGFERSNTPDNFFDVAIGNIPFGNYGVHDPAFNKHGFMIHDYFIAKSLEKVRTGGIVAYITSSGTMDKGNISARKYIAERAELLGAVRLPNTAFKQGAGAEVTTDILFLQKRSGIQDASKEDWVHSQRSGVRGQKLDGEAVGVAINSYFIANPHMMLGEMTQISGRYGMTAALLPFSSDNSGGHGGKHNGSQEAGQPLSLEQLLNEAIQHLPRDVMNRYGNYGGVNYDGVTGVDGMEGLEGAEHSDVTIPSNKTTIPADPNVKNHCFALVENRPYYRTDAVMNLVTGLAGKKEKRLADLISLRKQVRHVIDVQLANCSDKELLQEQEKLGHVYDGFVKKYGSINSAYNRNIFGEDAEYALVSSLEEVHKAHKAHGVHGETKQIIKSDIFFKRTIVPYRQAERADTAQEALAISLYENGRVDIGHIERLAGKTFAEVVTDLQGLIFKNPMRDMLEADTPGNNISRENILYKNWETADEFLSGDVVRKLEFARSMAGQDYEGKDLYAQNIPALEAMQPIPLQAHEIDVNIGASWIDPGYYKDFMIETLGLEGRWQKDRIAVSYLDHTNRWAVSDLNDNSVAAIQTYGTKRMSAYRLMERTLNGQQVEIRDSITTTNAGGKTVIKQVINRDETIAAKDRQRALNDAFRKWIFDEPARRTTLTGKYNRMFNYERAREYDGSFLCFAGMNPAIALRKHQKDAVARILFGGNTLLAHTVGAGKTYTMAAAAMEMRRLGLANKPCFVVPNHLVGQWSNEFAELYPAANILAAGKKDFTKQRRKLFMAKIATGDWDAVIIPQSFFERIPVSNQRQTAKLNSEIDQARSYLEEMKRQKGKDARWSQKQMEASLKKLEVKLQEIGSIKQDGLINFEDTGIDALFVDEAHAYKNKSIFSKKSRIAGLVLNSTTKRTKDMEMKVEYVNEVNNGEKNVVFATGTPISNSMAELYTMQSYLQRAKLKSIGHHHFDNWAADYGRVVSQVELSPDGKTFRTKERFSQFNNVARMMATLRMVADIKTREMLNLPVPDLRGGKPSIVSVDVSESQLELVKALVKASELIGRGLIKPEVYNMLVVTHHGSLGALDMRTMDVGAFKRLNSICVGKTGEDLGVDFDKLKTEDTEGSKVNTCVDKVYEIYKSTENDKLTQMIFCDRSTPKNVGDGDGDGNGGGNGKHKAAAFSVYVDIKAKLINKGVKESEIAFIHDAKTNEQKEKIFAKMRTGEIRILLGSTQKMGTGTNAQRLLCALHNLDAPWRPADLEQRAGRIIRQGNLNKEVEIFNYVTKGTFDAYLWQIIEGKQKYISQVMSGSVHADSISEADAQTLNYAEVKAIATGQPEIIRKMELEEELGKLKALERLHMANRHQNQDRVAKVLPSRIGQAENHAKNLARDIILRKENTAAAFVMQLGQKSFEGSESKKAAGDLILQAAYSGKYEGEVIGTYRGFNIIPHGGMGLEGARMNLQGSGNHTVELGSDGLGAVIRIDNALLRLDKALADTKEDITRLNGELEDAKAAVNTPFEYEEEMDGVQKELSAVNAKLNIGVDSHADIVAESAGVSGDEAGGVTLAVEAITAGVEVLDADFEDEWDVEV